MERSAEKDKFIKEYQKGLNDLPDNDRAIDNYRSKYDSKVRKLFGGWINFGMYQTEYQNSQDKPELSKSNKLENITQDSDISFKNNGNFTEQEVAQMKDIIKKDYLDNLTTTIDYKSDVVNALTKLQYMGFVVLPEDFSNRNKVMD